MRTKQGGNLGSATGRAKLKQRREPYWIVIARGSALGYRKGAKGGTWIARVRREDGQQAYQALGSADDLNDGHGMDYEAALAAARKHCGVMSLAGGRITVDQVFDTYLSHLRSNNPVSTVVDTESRVSSILRPEFGKLPLASLRAKHITRWRDKAAQTRKPDTVNRLLTILKAALNYAWREERSIADDSEWRLVSRLKGGGARKIFLTPSQAQSLLSHCKPPAFRNLVQAGLLTGARYGELVLARVRDFDANTATLEIQAGKTGARVVYLQDEALNFFRDLNTDRNADALLLPREDGLQWRKNHHQMS